MTHTGRRRSPTTTAVPLLAGFDTITYSSQARISTDIRAQLAKDKEAAQIAAKVGAVHCPEWLGARVLPSGGRGASFIVETEDFSVKIMGEHMETWPGLCVELRSFFLHTHEEGAQGAVKASLAWLREHLLADEDAKLLQALCSWKTVTPSRFDLHIDWQGGFAPSFGAGEVERFIKPRRLKWHPFFEGTHCTGYRFGSGDPILARLYNKSTERRARHDEGYFALLAASDDFASSHPRFALDLDFLLTQPLTIIAPLLADRPADWRYVRSLATALTEQLDQLQASELDWGLCHGDAQGGNAHLAPDGTLTFFDFDVCGFGWRVYDIAVFCWGAALGKARLGWDAQTVDRLRAAYLSGYEAVRPLRPMEHEAIDALVLLRQYWYLGLEGGHRDSWGVASTGVPSSSSERWRSCATGRPSTTS